MLWSLKKQSMQVKDNRKKKTTEENISTEGKQENRININEVAERWFCFHKFMNKYIIPPNSTCSRVKIWKSLILRIKYIFQTEFFAFNLHLPFLGATSFCLSAWIVWTLLCSSSFEEVSSWIDFTRSLYSIFSSKTNSALNSTR